MGRQGNWIVVPIPVANPTIGNGLQLAALYLHRQERRPTNRHPEPRPAWSTMATDSGARLLGGFHDSSFANDRFRLNAFAGSGQFNLKFYGTSENSQLVDNPLPYRDGRRSARCAARCGFTAPRTGSPG